MASGSVQTPEKRRKQVALDSPERDFVIVSPNEEPILLKSFLHKKGKRFRGWHLRYFEIQGTLMRYYKNANKTDCLGEIDLSLCFDCGPADEATFGASFEIHTSLRTHVMSTRSNEEREQWIEVIRTQSKTRSSEVKDKDTVKPKRWKTFKNAFQRRHRKSHDNILSADVTAASKRRTLFGRFRRGKNHQPSLREVNTESNLHSTRPMSMIDDTLTQDALEVLLDSKPSRSLPTTPLTKRRSNPMLFNPTEEPMFVDPTMTLPATIPMLSISAPTKNFSDPPEDLATGIQLMTPPLPLPKQSVTTAPVSYNGDDDGPMFGEPSCSSVTNPTPDIEVAKVDTKQTSSEDQPPQSERPISIIASEPVAVTEVQEEDRRYVIKDSNWEKIREVFSKESDEKWKNIVPLSYDVLPKQDQSWLNASSGIEGLRAFLGSS